MTRQLVQTIAALVLAWLVGLLMIWVLSALPVAAQSATRMTQCAAHDRVVAGLATGYGEVPVSIALGANNRVVETYASATTGSWTIIVTAPDGLTCVVASGIAFELISPPLPGVPG